MTHFLPALLAVVAHEGGHVLMTRLRGLAVRGLHVSWKGIGIRREAGTQADTVWIALAGPAMNLLVAAVFWSVPVPMLRNLNILFAVVNLLPLPSSDGRRAYAAFCRQRQTGTAYPTALAERRAA